MHTVYLQYADSYVPNSFPRCLEALSEETSGRKFNCYFVQESGRLDAYGP